ncbi:MAG: FkbM family methyltransferase [Algoriphagus sp.]|uniref:FkbM family methyltransferase n=1 Tax=Algoriphagus sp. TaxID=1872435 RepID=UPI0017F993A8|nr:FkbM family methyltransferase [Algoriphagus sp.]NVJ86805.1 FkbM family methyltransferase [Algoriphagus sp.]
MKKYYSQYRQDEFLNRVFFPHKKNGFFIDIGAHDGVKFSNSYFFELYRNWDGVCFEPNPKVFRELVENRKCRSYNTCIGDYDGYVTFCQVEGYSEMLSGIKEFYDDKHLDRISQEIKLHGGSVLEIDVPVKKIRSIPELTGKIIDFATIDTEGNELSVLKSIDFEKMIISAISIENNYNDNSIKDFLFEKGYMFIIRLGSDDIYLKSDLLSASIKIRTFLWRVRKKLESIIAKY